MLNDFDYLKDFGRKFEYKLIEIFDSFILNENTSEDEYNNMQNDVWCEVARHFAIKRSLLTKFEGKDIYIEKVKWFFYLNSSNAS